MVKKKIQLITNYILRYHVTNVGDIEHKILKMKLFKIFIKLSNA